MLGFLKWASVKETTLFFEQDRRAGKKLRNASMITFTLMNSQSLSRANLCPLEPFIYYLLDMFIINELIITPLLHFSSIPFIRESNQSAKSEISVPSLSCSYCPVSSQSYPFIYLS